MKESLTQLAQQIIDSIEIDVNQFRVYAENDILPELIKSILFQSDYMVCIWVDRNDTDIAKEQYESFLHKPVNVINKNHHNILYWFEGFSLKTSIKESYDDQSNIIKVEKIRNYSGL